MKKLADFQADKIDLKKFGSRVGAVDGNTMTLRTGRDGKGEKISVVWDDGQEPIGW